MTFHKIYEELKIAESYGASKLNSTILSILLGKAISAGINLEQKVEKQEKDIQSLKEILVMMNENRAKGYDEKSKVHSTEAEDAQSDSQN